VTDIADEGAPPAKDADPKPITSPDPFVGAFAAREPTSILEVVAELKAIDAALPTSDGIAWFTKLYLSVTEAVQAALRPGTFQNPTFLERLDVVFAQLYVTALSAALRDPSSVPKAWAPLVDARTSHRVAPIQFALAGMNAHINRDLPVALVSTCEQLRIDLEQATREHADFTHVNDLLAETEQSVKQWFATGFVGVVDVGLGDIDDHIAMWDVGRARETAWVQAQTLWTLRAVPQIRDQYLRALDRMVGFAGRGLLVPLG